MLRNLIFNFRNRESEIALNQALDSLPCPPIGAKKLLRPLPIAHLTSVESYEKIVECYALKAQNCHVFKRKLLYFSYGGIFHRFEKEPTGKAASLPVAFLFKPSLLARINYLFPYDTGAANKGLYRRNKDLRNFDKYKISNSGTGTELAPKLVYYFFGTNKHYLYGNVISNFKHKYIVLQNLFNFLSLSDPKVDQRHRSIECQSENSISLLELLKGLEWVGLPVRNRDDFRDLYYKNDLIDLPRIHGYLYDNTSRSSDDITSKLEEVARQYLEERYL